MGRLELVIELALRNVAVHQGTVTKPKKGGLNSRPPLWIVDQTAQCLAVAAGSLDDEMSSAFSALNISFARSVSFAFSECTEIKA